MTSKPKKGKRRTGKRKTGRKITGPVRPLGPSARAYRAYRLTTSPVRIFPSFAIIGAQRAGTTSLFDDLLRHGEIAGPSSQDKRLAWPEKELDFFSNRFYEGLNWYRAFFPLALSRARAERAGRRLVAGEATPYYLLHPGAPERMAATLPGMKLIVLLRDPVARAHSHYQMNRRRRIETLSFEKALAAEARRLSGEAEHVGRDTRYRSRPLRLYSYFERGLYAEQLERWFAHFPREQFSIHAAEDYFARTDEIYGEVLSLIGVAPKRIADLPRRRRLGRRQPPTTPGRNRAKYDPIDPATKAELEERYAEPNARLVELLGRDLPWPSPGAARQGTVTPAMDAS